FNLSRHSAAARFALLAAVLHTAACGDKPKAGADAPAFNRAATQADLTGLWKLEYDATWPLPPLRFLQDNMKGADAYSKDPAEKEKQVKEAMAKMLGGTTFHYHADGKLTERIASMKK